MKNRKYRNQRFNILTLEKRKKLEKLLKENVQIKDIEEILKISKSVIYRERMRMGTLEIPYKAEIAHEHAYNARKYINPTSPIPGTHKTYLLKLNKNLNELKKKNLCNKSAAIIDDCIFILSFMGIDTKKRPRSAVTSDEKEKIIRMWKAGESYLSISKAVNRSRSTISKYIMEKNNNLSNTTTEELIYEDIRRKWITEND